MSLPDTVADQRRLMDKPTLRLITCGSVDNGKSTLIGRLLYESRNVFEDQLEALREDSRRYGTQGDDIDFALLVDGLQAEREQGITIDVAYRFFATGSRRYVVADTPGHEQYTCNMATGASTADLAVILVDACKGVLTQTRRHTRIAALLGIRHIVVAINKMDLTGFDEQVFNTIVADYASFASSSGFVTVQAIPVSSLYGDNVVTKSTRTPWYRGPSLLEYLDAIDAADTNRSVAFRMPVQWVNRWSTDFRGYCGSVVAGSVRVGDPVRVLPSGVSTRIARVIAGGEARMAGPGDAVTVTLADDVDVSRGDMLVAATDPPETASEFVVKLIWMGELPMRVGQQYLMKLACREVSATIRSIEYREDVNTGERLGVDALERNGIAAVSLTTGAPVAFEPYRSDRTLGSFILIDRLTFETVGAGMIDSTQRRARNVHWQTLELNQAARAEHKLQTPRCIWFTGLSGAGKSTIANWLEKRLHLAGRHTYLLDGDNLRHGLNRDLGFTEADRAENIRRVGELARLMVDAGLIVLASFISPSESERQAARRLFGDGEFVEVFVDTSLEECERRDVKGLYAKARRGELQNFTGIDSNYESPAAPEVHLYAGRESVERCVQQILTYLGEA